MRKVITLVILIIITVSALSVCVNAEELVSNESVSVSTVYERAVEWWKVHEEEISSVASLGATVLFGLFFGKIKSGIKDLIGKFGAITNASVTHSKTTGDLVVGYNSQVDEIKALKNKNAALQEINIKNSEDIRLIKKEIGIIAHIISTAYTNSKALPQGTKNMINLECAECMRLAGEGEAIAGDTINENIEKN